MLYHYDESPDYEGLIERLLDIVADVESHRISREKYVTEKMMRVNNQCGKKEQLQL